MRHLMRGRRLNRSSPHRTALFRNLARALVGRPRLLILDGVLDALDLRACPDLLPRLFDRSAPWTLLVATADPDIIRRCDRVIEFGRHDHPPVIPLTPVLAEGTHP